MDDFCIYILTHRGDFLHTKLLCQSIRYFCGDVPIVILRDGDFSINQLKKLGNVSEFNPNLVPTPIRNFTGYLRKLHILFNEQYKRFLYLDADTILIADILAVPFSDYDFYVDATQDEVSDLETKNRVSKLIFHIDELSKFDQDFIFEGLITFNSGHFFGRPGLIPLDLVLETRLHTHKSTKDKKIFSFDQGLLNYFFNKGKQEKWFSFGGSKIAITPSWEPPEKYPTLNLRTLLSKQYTERFVMHFTTPVRKQLLRNYPYGYILSEFYKQYYANFPAHIRYLDELERMPRLLYQSTYNLARNIRNQIRKGIKETSNQLRQ